MNHRGTSTRTGMNRDPLRFRLDDKVESVEVLRRRLKPNEMQKDSPLHSNRKRLCDKCHESGYAKAQPRLWTSP